ncbi:DUF440 family protein [Thorsellia anophelis]|uniref:DsDNA-mimic protein n=1 Tax=Thorsellia anophelis DSM 18579 TaxID=1123402 RepID=A0A1H9ZCX9_9GAMM|nr:DUF440 family protein [Thorsellia anophelis]SES79483.1 hypothetical protein SAMN02583745_00533 [Thorsellia anophelis DSM 18579]
MYLTDEQALDIAFELFSELASDNLNPDEMSLYNTHFSSTGFIELYDFEPSTLDEIALDPNEHETTIKVDEKSGDQFVEILIGARPSPNQAELLFAKIVLNLKKEDKHSHIQWMSDLY